MNPRWPDEAAFYDDDERRDRSPEVDFGTRWTDTDGDYKTRWRVSWIDATGELIAVAQSTTSNVWTGTPLPKVELLGWYPNRGVLDRALADWTKHVNEPGSLAWLRRRVATTGTAGPAVTARDRDEGFRRFQGARGVGEGQGSLL